ncbi:hypothetical protein PVAP13_2KG384700 [Panicum virgatum]|uniref:Uncharacterized protein n=1 Tax=Panicum virgatum TaxID=38727 RepID=A0A8T0WFF1_PANVG|nr:hypothetical protein PVAP13_2KG384700 [Panicum virgatum]
MDDWMAGGMHGGRGRFWRPREKRRSGCCSVACQSFGHPSTPASWVDPGGNIIIGSTRDEIVQGESCLQRDTFSVFRQVGKKKRCDLTFRATS